MDSFFRQSVELGMRGIFITWQLQNSYEVVEGTVTEIHAELLFDGFKRVLVQGDDGITTELLLNKETVVMYGKAYRFYFNQNAHAFSGIRRLDAAFDFGNFFWSGGSKRVIRGREYQAWFESMPPCFHVNAWKICIKESYAIWRKQNVEP